MFNPLTRLAYFIIGHENIPVPESDPEVNTVNTVNIEPKKEDENA
jgi:hypothetical protein